MAKKGRRFEHRVVKGVDRATDDTVNVYPVGYSGNGATSAEDVLISDASTGINYAAELKNISSDRCYVDVEQLEGLVERNNGQTVSVLIVKFSRREAIVTRYYDNLSGVDGAESYNDKSVAEKFATLLPDCTNPRITDGESLALDKPSTEDWPSATKGSSDVEAICSGIGLKTEQSIEIER